MEPRDLMNLIIYVIVAIGSVWAVIRLYQDLTRPLPEDSSSNTDKNIHADTDKN